MSQGRSPRRRSGLRRSLRLAEPKAQVGGGAGVADARIIGREAAVTFQCTLEGSAGPDLAEVDPEAQFREPIREPNPKGAIGRRTVVGQMVFLGG